MFFWSGKLLLSYFKNANLFSSQTNRLASGNAKSFSFSKLNVFFFFFLSVKEATRNSKGLMIVNIYIGMSFHFHNPYFFGVN